MVTIRQVAESAQVSPGTVSQLLNGRAKLRPETRQRIERAIDRLGYRRRRAGRPRVNHPHHHFGMLVSSPPSTAVPTHPLHRRRINHLRETFTGNGDQFSLLPANMPVDENWAFGDAIRSGHIDGVIMDGHAEARGYAAWLREQRVAHVVLERTPAMREFSCVCVDGVTGGQLAAEHLIERGRTRLAYVHPHREFSWTHERRHGFFTTSARSGLEPVGVWRFDPDGADDERLDVCAALCEQRIDGVFASSDGLAIKLIDGLEHHGATVPGDIAVVGFDNLELASASGLRPTSIAYDHRKIAQAVMRTIKQLLNDPVTSALATYLRPTLAPHDTT